MDMGGGIANGSEILITSPAEGFISETLPDQAEADSLTRVCPGALLSESPARLH